MKTSLSIVVALLLFSVSAAQATPIRGTFTGVVTAAWSWSPDPTYVEFPVGTLASAIFGYDSAYLYSPDEFGNRYTSIQEGYEGFFWARIGNQVDGFSTQAPYGGGFLLIGPNGLPAAGGGASSWDTQVFSNGFRWANGDRSVIVEVEGTYSLPEHQSTLPLTLLGLAALAVSRRFL